jgi:hypothetical protein
VIYAYSTEVPSSSAVDAHLVRHVDHGVMQFNLAKDTPSSTSSSTALTSPSTSLASPSPSNSLPHHALPVNDIPLLRYQRYIVVHAVFCTLGFLIFLPAGVLFARYLRTFTPIWFQGHWIVQFVFGVSRYFSPVLFSHYICTQLGPLSLWVLCLGFLQFQRQKHNILTTNTRYLTGFVYCLAFLLMGVPISS